MQIYYKNIDLEIFVNKQKKSYNINKDINIDLIRDHFNGAIGELSQKHNFLEYWLMRISERNTLVNNLFLDICKIKLIEQLHKEHNDLVINTNNISIYIYFKKISKINIQNIFRFETKKIYLTNKPYLQLVKYIMKKALFRIRYADKTYTKDLSKFVVIQTWVSDSNFKFEKFKDSYYGDLAGYLKNNDKQAVTWPVFFNVKDEQKAMSYLRKNSDNFLVMEDYLQINDYIEAVKHFFVKRSLEIKSIKIGEDDYTSIFKHYQKKEIAEDVSLFYSFAKRLAKNGSKNITFISNHENMISEKALILGIRKYLPCSRIIGYFHTTKPKNQLCLEYATIEEYKIAPKPDKIIFNSGVYREYYEKKYRDTTMYDGVAFKQLSLRDKIQNKDIDSNKTLVLFSGTNDEIVLMFSLLNGLKNEYEFLFRMHPMNQFDVSKYYNKHNYKIVNNESLDESLSKVNKVISTYSAVALESALKGFTVGLVYNNNDLLQNPFDYTDIDNYRLISCIDELYEFLEQDFEFKKTREFFNLDEKYYKVFLEIT